MTYDINNIFAKICGEVPCDKIFENGHALAFKDIQPQAPEHILVIPKGPYISFEDFSANANDDEILAFSTRWSIAREAGIVRRLRFCLITAMMGDRGAFPVHVLGGRDLGGMVPASHRRPLWKINFIDFVVVFKECLASQYRFITIL